MLLKKKLDRNIYRHERHYVKATLQDLPDRINETSGFKKRKLRDLSLEDKVDLIHDVITNKDYHDNICARYSINRESLKSLIKSYKKDPSCFRKQHEKNAA